MTNAQPNAGTNTDDLLGARRNVDTPVGEIGCHERGAGPNLVFLHGVLTNADLWTRTVPLLADTHRCVTLDLPLGAHATPALPEADLAPDGIAAAVAAVLRDRAPEGCVLVGNDTGGVVAQLVATTAPELLHGLVLTSCDTYDNSPPRALRHTKLTAHVPGGVWLMVQALRLRLMRELPFAYGWLARQPVEPELWQSFLGPAQRDAGVRRDLGKVLRGVSSRHTKQTARELREFKRPTLFPWADTDRVFPVAHAHRLAAAMPDARVRPIEDSYAFVPLDQPERLAQEIRSYVDRRISPTL